tara:strand:- start:3728 stop:4927 length:1200 start_codon:yes stop_codon:yes gene_type:complete
MIKKILIFLSIVSLSYSETYKTQDSFNKFGISLFKKISYKDNSTFMISPISISYALMMVKYGASGKTYDEILSVLNLSNPHLLPNNNLKDFFDLYSRSNSLFQINNSIWIQNDKCYQPNLEYVNYIDSVFNGKVSYVDFYNDRLSIIEDINDWVNENTFGTIKDIVSENDIKKYTTQALINSIYFKDNWQFPFDTLKTSLNPFLAKDETFQLMFMNKKNKFAHYQSSDFHLLEIPYQSDGVSMYIFLPSEDVDLNMFISNFDYQLFTSSIDSLRYNLGDVYIPKFKLDYSVSLKDFLIDMGMPTPFNPKDANFDKFWDFQQQCKKYPPKHYIDVVNHKTYINIDEHGTEASAATAIIISRVTSIRPVEPFIFNANRPFVYVVYDKINDNIMFLGQFSGK